MNHLCKNIMTGKVLLVLTLLILVGSAECKRKKPKMEYKRETKLLLHFDGDFEDSSRFSQEVDFGDASIDTTNVKFGSGSALFDSATDVITITNSPEFIFGSNDFTIDLRIRYTLGSTCAFFHQREDDNKLILFKYIPVLDTLSFTIYDISSGPWNELVYLYATITNFEDGEFHHVAITRNCDKWYLFYDGIVIDSDIGNAFDIGSIDADIEINYLGTYRGNIDEFRILNGMAAWTSDFDLPTSAYTIGQEVRKIGMHTEPTFVKYQDLP